MEHSSNFDDTFIPGKIYGQSADGVKSWLEAFNENPNHAHKITEADRGWIHRLAVITAKYQERSIAEDLHTQDLPFKIPLYEITFTNNGHTMKAFVEIQLKRVDEGDSPHFAQGYCRLNIDFEASIGQNLQDAITKFYIAKGLDPVITLEHNSWHRLTFNATEMVELYRKSSILQEALKITCRSASHSTVHACFDGLFDKVELSMP